MAQDADYGTEEAQDTVDRLPAWQEWKARCARGLCSHPHQALLATFAGQRFNTYVHRYATHGGTRDDRAIMRQYPADDAWHLFETHLCAKEAPGGKHFKDWLFARPASPTPLQGIEAGASIILRDVVRERLRIDYAPPACISIETGFFADDCALPTAPTLFLARATPIDEAAANEYAELALEHARQAFDNMTDRERVAVLCRELGLSFSDPTVTRATGCRKSTLYDTYHNFFGRMARWMQETYPDDDPESVMALTLLLVRGVTGRLRDWARQARCCVGLRGPL